MKLASLVLITTIMNFSSNVLATVYKREAGSCLPISNAHFESGNKSLNGLSEIDYNQILDKVQSILGPEIKKRLDKNLIIDRKWADPTVDAFATRDDANNAVIVINGGLARHPLMTRDGFLLLVCHEIGHHLGGAPKILRGNSGLKSWSSAEGQADYYATTKCLPKFFQQGIENKKFDYDIDANNLKLALSKCRDNVCARIALSGLAVTQVFASLVAGT
ncbi:MAG: hypothetical protein Q7U04_17200, partial [Bacteriovorax sp.]|nr:hypothetical protein [Bacteriovorax sp.]